MGASVLPTTIYKNKIFFLFGKERKNNDTPGWSDFGGGKENDETYLETAIREGGEETTGFLGDEKQIRHLLTKYGTYNIDLKANDKITYRVHIFPTVYDESLPYYYNNNQRFLQKKLDPKFLDESKIFEKDELRWICMDELPKMKNKFRSFYQNIVDLILQQKAPIYKFIKKHSNRHSKTHSNRNSNRHSKTQSKKT